MTKLTKNDKPNPRIVYGDIIDMPHHQSLTHPHMSLYDRAAQFAPFAALTGYEDMISEETKLTEAAFSADKSLAENFDEFKN